MSAVSRVLAIDRLAPRLSQLRYQFPHRLNGVERAGRAPAAAHSRGSRSGPPTFALPSVLLSLDHSSLLNDRLLLSRHAIFGA